MADVKRYMLEWSNALGEHMGEHPDGAWVSWQDYAALKAENERLKESQQREPKDWETVCHECDGSGWRAASY